MGKRGKQSEIERFWAKTKREGACLVWTGALGKWDGYGIFRAYRPGRKLANGKRLSSGVTVRAHRFIYERVFGKLPRKIEVMHSCDNRRCVALQHLSPGSHQFNLLDAANKGRTPQGGRNGQAKLTARQIKAIRRQRAAGLTQAEVAKRFRISQGHVSDIVTSKRWAHLK
jgi:DNA-binding transcriptional regulator YiaG